ncbi:class I SAM-dependent methyltransferase [Amycolatopsis sp. CA-230715]|uniref:class I SAM-dependent methyltransferase n=1 Tax=Amycolatopsis sp. CA-230715 TaxID=2745196 RepID=UPI001C015D6A|nr:class I SAM-dependent methyltransferase [Amycolatopsis sp. CA-230715]QWF85971.1 Phenylpyruvate C(3)-methyltransferase [Amycolatopsis sp. CA-230715]
MSTFVEKEPGVRSAADIFNSAVAAPAIGAAWELGALEDLHTERELDVDAFAAKEGLDPVATMAVFAALASVGVVDRAGRRILPGPVFDEVYETKPLFYWLCQGSWELFVNMQSVVKAENRVGDEFYRRDAKAVSRASRAANATFFDPLFWHVMDGLKEDFSVVADLGSGSGGRLIQIANRYPGTRGIGLDISGATIEMSTAEVARVDLADRISFQVADVRSLEPRPEFADVELLTCFLMGHDLWPRENCVDSLRRLRAAFPKVKRFVLGDTVRSQNIPDDKMPIFSLGFEVGHALMGTYIPTAEEWGEVFEEGGWRCVDRHVSEALAGTTIFELESVG